MAVVVALISILIIVFVLVDGFEVVVLPRRVMRSYRFARFFYRVSWGQWRALGRLFVSARRREAFLGYFGPLSLLALIASWVIGLVGGFAGLHWAIGSPVTAGGGEADFFTYLYLSGTTFFTLGYGDVTPLAVVGRCLSIVEAGLGFAFLAGVISYLPVLYQAFSRRELTISLLDARAGSPPSAGQFLVRLAQAHQVEAINPFLMEWERWAAEVLESQLSYPVLSYYRSQHDNQSWLAALTAMLDTCALFIAGIKDADTYQAQLTFAMARHAVVDLALVFRLSPPKGASERLPPARLEELRGLLASVGLRLVDDTTCAAKLNQLRAMYEPFAIALAQHFVLVLPPFLPETAAVDNWQSSPWARRTPGIGKLPLAEIDGSID
jgi:hypothetical protein